MPEVWQTIEQAAVTLGLSVRTVNRHITGGKLESRLFEGRREVLIALPEPVRPATATKPSPDASKPAAGSASSEPTSVNFTMGSSATPSASDVPPVNAPVNTDAAGTVGSGTRGAAAAAGPAYDSVRRAMSADYADEKPLDLRTMLTLADSADDKASLAVAAYQTLAHASELQVQSLRKVALGAWASVGVLAAGAILAVGWGTYRLTSAEGTSAHLRNQVTEQKSELDQLTQERDRMRNDLMKVQIESARLQDRLAQLADAQSVAEIARYALRNLKQADVVTAATVSATTDKPTSPDTRPATQTAGNTPIDGRLPTAGDSATGDSATSQPSTRPALMAAGGPVTQPASKPAMTGQRPTYITNSREPFDPR